LQRAVTPNTRQPACRWGNGRRLVHAQMERSAEIRRPPDGQSRTRVFVGRSSYTCRWPNRKKGRSAGRLISGKLWKSSRKSARAPVPHEDNEGSGPKSQRPATKAADPSRSQPSSCAGSLSCWPRMRGTTTYSQATSGSAVMSTHSFSN